MAWDEATGNWIEDPQTSTEEQQAQDAWRQSGDSGTTSYAPGYFDEYYANRGTGDVGANGKEAPSMPMWTEADYAAYNAEDPTKGMYGDYYRDIVGQNVNRNQPWGAAAAQNQMDRQRQMAAIRMLQNYAGGQNMVAPSLLQAQRNALAMQRAQAMGNMDPRSVLMAMRAVAPQQLQQAATGMQMVPQERIAARQGTLGALEEYRQGDLGYDKGVLQREQSEAEYRNALQKLGVGYLGMGEQAKQVKMASELGLLGGFGSGAVPQEQPSFWSKFIPGVANMASSALASWGSHQKDEK